MVTENANIRINVDRVKVEGCWCFSLHSSRDGRGRSYFHVDVGPSRGSSVRRPGSEDPHRLELILFVVVILILLLIS